MVDNPVIVQRSNGRDNVLWIQAYLVNADNPFLCGKRMLELWQSKVDTKRRILETEIDGKWRDFKMMIMTGSHYGIILEKKGRKSVDVLFLYDHEGVLTSFKAITKVYEVNNNKKKEQLISAYQNTGWMSPEVVNTIN